MSQAILALSTAHCQACFVEPTVGLSWCRLAVQVRRPVSMNQHTVISADAWVTM